MSRTAARQLVKIEWKNARSKHDTDKKAARGLARQLEAAWPNTPARS
jgi:hypothetical protein